MKQKLPNLIPLVREGVKKSLLTIGIVLFSLTFSTLQANADDLGKDGKSINNATLISLDDSEQQRTVSGTVSDENGSAMPGVNIQFKAPASEQLLILTGNILLMFPEPILCWSFHSWVTMN